MIHIAFIVLLILDFVNNIWGDNYDLSSLGSILVRFCGRENQAEKGEIKSNCKVSYYKEGWVILL